MVDCRVTKWHSICDFLAEEDIPFRECSDGIYRPDFEKVSVDKEFQCKLEDKYVKAFNDYMKFCRETFLKEV